MSLAAGPRGRPADAWARSFAEEVEAGHAGRTLQLVGAVRRTSGSGPLAQSLGLEQLRSQLNQESSAAGRNRLFRRWLAQHREAVLAAWEALGFPAAPSAAAAEPAAAEPPPPGSRGSGSQDAGPPSRVGGPPRSGGSEGSRGVAVFDFDQTITIRHVGVFEDLGQFCERSLGGAERLGMLKAMLARLRSLGIAVAVVTRNSRQVVKQALERAGLLGFVERGFIFGFEDYEDDVPKSRVVRERVLPSLGLSAHQLFFADDDAANIADVQERLPGAKLLHCPRQGLRPEDCEEIVCWASRFG